MYTSIAVVDITLSHLQLKEVKEVKVWVYFLYLLLRDFIINQIKNNWL